MAGPERKLSRSLQSSAGSADRHMIRRGAAIQALIDLSEHNSLAISNKRFALSRLKANAAEKNGQAAVSDDPGPLRFTQSQLRLLRQEQLMLMAENERLVHELQEIRRCRIPGQFRPGQARAVPEFRESKLSKAIDLTLSGGRDTRLQAARIGFLCAVVARVRIRLLSSAFRVLSRQPLRSLLYASSRVHNSGQPSIRQVMLSCMVLETAIRSKVQRIKRLGLRLLRNPGAGSASRLQSAFGDYSRAPGGLSQSESRPAGKFCSCDI
ncbi:hypothetical protein, conserved [Babesia bigemina]|uniref:Uncharacterized protein n=1 Tax=Babesia bigemina TaxID=5866 RepID=A0A061D7Q4_BABBI|nr:hypothetical protein, conserved [Babesia bigemina]CDR96022.1 hypothetical protein, conserved [Babesia bigemina]|eukprot:XP_012768208.1 hypothetical protein, conserved [Babesia bigemina]